MLYGTIVYGLASAILSAKPDAPVSSHPPYRRAIACAVFLVTLAGAIGNNLPAFVDIPSIIFLTLSLIILYAILKASKSETIFEALAHYLPYVGLIGFLMGVIGMLGGMPDPRAIGPEMAMACLTLLYSNIASVLIKLAKPSVIGNKDPLNLGYLTSVIVGISITTAVLLLSFA
ncbi:MotA/TolQ/ExbB proton channel family protein [Gammaproteobacteria bacterium]|nr:MotA/TolQ/ExbB proton channel family protein [Gammaproteobacteria bacterium]MDC1426307.1 MotA/TolQ/ExbB proton channel family protein [Gammaproteobacteria bacterium]